MKTKNQITKNINRKYNDDQETDGMQNKNTRINSIKKKDGNSTLDTRADRKRVRNYEELKEEKEQRIN